MAFKVQTLQTVHPKHTYLTRLWNQMKYGFKWYCEKTSLHGFHYITNKNSSMFTRVFFALVSCCSFILCSYLIALQLLEHQRQSMLTTVRSTAYPVWRVRFPAVTICNFNVIYKNNIESLMNIMEARGINKKVFVDVVQNLSSLIVLDDLKNTTEYQEVFDALKRGGYTVDRLMAELAQPCDSMVKKCYWQTEEIPCSYIFESVKTSQGYCCSFNYYGTRDSAHDMDDPQSLHYQYVGGAGPTLGLRLFLDVEEDQYVSTIRPSYGLNVLVQDGADYPDMDLIANTLLTAEEMTISVTPRIYVSTDDLRGMQFSQRRCLFEDEGKLQWSSTYSYKTCISECKAKAILEYCNCVPYYYPVHNSKRICTLLDIPCLQNNKYKYSAVGITDSFLTAGETQSVRSRIENVIQCKCYPQCNERMFDFHTDRAKATQMAGFEYSNMSILNVYYNTVGCVKTDRDAYYTWDRVFASIGGIFGLCLGGSVISILECFYCLGRCVPSCKKTKPKQPEIYVSDFAYRQYGSNFGRKPFVNSKMHMIKNGFNN